MIENLLAALVRGDQIAWPFAGAQAEQDFLDAARNHGVLPLIGWRHRRQNVLDGWPATLQQAIASRVRHHSIAEHVHHGELSAVAGALAARSVRAIVLKGAALAHTHYPHPCLRPREDFDLLVREADVDAATDALQARGYAPLDAVSGRFVAYQQTFVRDGAGGVRHACDLHWRVSNRPAFAQLLPWDDLAAGARPVRALDDAVDALAPAHALLVACLHRVAHHYDAPTLIWLYDIHLLAGSLTEDEASRFVALAREHRVASICARGIAVAAHHFRTVLPEPLTHLAPAGEEPLVAYMDTGLRPVDVLISDLRALTGWSARVQLLREHLFPSPRYLRSVASHFGSGPLPVVYARRIFRGASRWLRAANET